MLFWIILFVVIYFAVKAVSNNKKKNDLQLAKNSLQKSRVCPDCAEEIRVEAKKCRYCASTLEPCSEEEMEQIEIAYQKKLVKLDETVNGVVVDKKYKGGKAWK